MDFQCIRIHSISLQINLWDFFFSVNEILLDVNTSIKQTNGVFFIVLIFRSIQLSWKQFFYFQWTNSHQCLIQKKYTPLETLWTENGWMHIFLMSDIHYWKILAPIETLWCWLLKAHQYIHHSLILFTLKCAISQQMFLFIWFDHMPMSLHQKCFPSNTWPIRRIIGKPK